MQFEHRFLNVNGTRVHAVEAGEGPLVLFLHGFPELWYSWRHQIPAVAAAGYRAVAIDQRGFGRSSKFWSPDAYRIHRLVEDVVGTVHALGGERAVVIGHDWGAAVAWTAAWLYPRVFRGVMGMSVPFSGRGLIALPGSPFGERRPVDLHREIAGPGMDFYQTYFGTLGAVIEEIEADLRGWIRDLVWGVSGEVMTAMGQPLPVDDPIPLIRASGLCIPHGAKMRDRFPAPAKQPDWFTEADLDYFVREFEGSGFSGPLSYYRNLDQDWQDLANIADRPLEVPAMFLGSDFDIATWWGAEAVARAAERIPNYLGSRMLQGMGHWIQQEQPDQTNAVILDFLTALA